MLILMIYILILMIFFRTSEMAYVCQLLELIYFAIITPWLDHADFKYAYTKEDSHWAFETPPWEQNLPSCNWP